jgi:hypothetical protein
MLFLTQIAAGNNSMTKPANHIPLRITVDIAVILFATFLIGLGFWIGVLW